jgi:hypothetical protein
MWIWGNGFKAVLILNLGTRWRVDSHVYVLASISLAKEPVVSGEQDADLFPEL